jgi:hypothetical protein
MADAASWNQFGEEEGTDGKDGTFSHSHSQHHHAPVAVTFTNGGASSGIAAAGKQLLRTGISSGSAPAAEQALFRQQLTQIYSAYCPDKLKSIDALLKKFAGQEEYLLKKVKRKYHVTTAH